jgi:predicted murein hydrolase (TIGR00659 family)
MRELLSSPVLWIAVTFAVYYGAQVIYKRYHFFFLNPVLVSISVLILILVASGVEFSEYDRGGKYISFFLAPAVVALGVPLHERMREIRARSGAILTAIGIGGAGGILSAAGIAAGLGASRAVVLSIAPKSVTTPIAIGIAEKLGGVPSLTAVLVIAAGVLGAVLGPIFLRAIGVRSPYAFGLAMGAASHGIGTARALEEGEVEGATSGLALCLNGIVTAVLTPVLVPIFT